MQQIIINVEDNKSDIVLNFIKKAYMELSGKAFEKIWDNKEDETYDRFLQHSG